MTVFVAIVFGVLIFVVGPIIGYDSAVAVIKQLREEYPNKSEEEFAQMHQRAKSVLIKIWSVIAAAYLFVLFLYFIQPLF